MLGLIADFMGPALTLVGKLVDQYSDPEKVRQRNLQKIKDDIKHERIDLKAMLNEVYEHIASFDSIPGVPQGPAGDPKNPPAVPDGSGGVQASERVFEKGSDGSKKPY